MNKAIASLTIEAEELKKTCNISLVEQREGNCLKKGFIIDLVYFIILTLIYSYKAPLTTAVMASVILVSSLDIANYIFYNVNKRYSKWIVIVLSTIGISLSFHLVFNNIGFISVLGSFLLSTFYYYNTKKKLANKNSDK